MRVSWLLVSVVVHGAAIGAAVGLGLRAGFPTPPPRPHVELQRTVASTPSTPTAPPVPPLFEEAAEDVPLPPEPELAQPIEPPSLEPTPVSPPTPPVRPTLQRVVVEAAPAEPAPAEAAPAAEPSADVEPERCADNPPPNYPPRERRLGHEGVVTLRVLVGADGAVVRVELLRSSGHPGLDREAVRAVEGWRFVPGQRHGAPFACATDIEVEFRLRD